MFILQIKSWNENIFLISTWYTNTEGPVAGGGGTKNGEEKLKLLFLYIASEIPMGYVYTSQNTVLPYQAPIQYKKKS